jgi:uncharacterized protein
MSERNKQTVRRFLFAMSDGDAAAAATCLASDAVAVTKGFSNFTGSCDRETIVRLVGSMKALVPTGLRITIHALIADGDMVAAEFEGDAVTIDGKPYCNQYCMVFRLLDGLIVHSHEYFCTKLAESQLWPAIVQMGLEADAGSN